ncbi:hypothetical protein ZQ34_003992 [Salmonella enterica subsp. salamae]|nr:hypothetical protein [Salmonella enterica subsp. salamae]EED7441392.1 hypothetical protein [Salmonella enterica subsp. salamae]EEI9684424.1 hypothetical protein [Salmonella enterica]EKN4992907.1 hypothetical protein [Salmonella enterica]EKT4207014.1 hypothetical protein [Salmonella enterica]
MDKQVDQAWLEALLALFCQWCALVPGDVNSTTFRILAELARVRNGRILNAMEVHLVQGWTRGKASAMYGVSPGYFSRRVADLNRVWQLTEILRMNRESTGPGGESQGGNHDTSEM